MPSQVIRVRSALGVAEISRFFQAALNGRKVKFGKIDDGDNPFATVETQPDFSAVASHDKSIGSWAVQIYVYDEDNSRLVELHVVYHSGFSRVMHGTQNTYSKSAGIKSAHAVIAALQQGGLLTGDWVALRTGLSTQIEERERTVGLFSRQKATQGEIGTFHSPHSPEDTLRAVYAGLANELSSGDSEELAPFKLSAPGIMESIYISRLEPNGISVTAGNTTNTYFAFHVNLTPIAHGVEGYAYFDRPPKSIQRWMGNAIQITAGVRMALGGASVKVIRWKDRF